MSSVVKGVSRAIGSVVDGVKNVVSKVTSSKFGKVALMAAAVYFGGAALSGAMAGGGTAMGGLQNAWTSLGTAGTEAMAGNLSNAGSALSTGFQGGEALAQDGGIVARNMGGLTGSVTPTTAPQMAGVQNATDSIPRYQGAGPSSGVNYANGADIGGAGSSPGTLNTPAGGLPSTPPKAAGGFIDKVMNSPYGPGAVVMAGGQLAGGLIQGYSAQQQQKYQEDLAAQARARANANVSTRLWS